MLKVVGASWTTSRVGCLTLGTVGVVLFVFAVTWDLERNTEDGNYSATVFWSERTGFKIEFWGEGNDLDSVPKGAARAVYRPDIENSGWAMLEVQSQTEYTDDVQAYAAGFLEGCLSWQLIYHHWMNTVREACEDREEYCQRTRHFLRDNTEAIRATALLHQNEDHFWHQVHLFYVQLDGIRGGWQYGMLRSLGDLRQVVIPEEDFLWMNVASDLVDLEYVYNGSYEDSHSPLALSAANMISSAFVKLLPASGQLFVAHNSAGLYRSMLKMLKRYHLNYHVTDAPGSVNVPGQVLVFSSYPGAIHSQDDFYQVSGMRNHQLAITGSAIRNFNPVLWDKVNAQDQVLLGPRAMAANRLATTVKSWGHFLGRCNSGTGNKQWLVVDPKRIARKSKKGLLLVVEQLPGYTRASDHSHLLRNQGYWANHGLPFHQDIQEASGTLAMEKQFGSMYSSKESPVARIYHRYQLNATDAASIRRLMRSNEYLSEPLSNGSPLQAVAVRGDLEGMPNNNVIRPVISPLGTTDFKLLSITKPSKTFQLQALAGPAFSNEMQYSKSTLPPFKWSSSQFKTQTHIGQPDVWTFEITKHSWSWN